MARCGGIMVVVPLDFCSISSCSGQCIDGKVVQGLWVVQGSFASK